MLNVRPDNALHVVCPKQKVEIVQTVDSKWTVGLNEGSTHRAPNAGIESGPVHGSGATDPVEIRGGARRDRRRRGRVQRCATAAVRRVRENPMLNSKTLDDLAARIGKAFEGSPAKDIEKNITAMLQSGLARLDLVTRQEFDVQAEVLRKTRDKVERLEARVTELEARMPAPESGA